MSTPIILILLPFRSEKSRPPSETPLGRAAILARELGVEVLFASKPELCLGVHENKWVESESNPTAVYDRFPSRSQSTSWTKLWSRWGHLPWSNSPELTELCSDKIKTQAVVGGMPEVLSDYSKFQGKLEEWGSGFIKPRFGALGRGVQRITAGNHIPRMAEGAVRGVLEPTILQREVVPPNGFGSLSLRVLVQGSIDGWVVEQTVARVSNSGNVANVALGARPVAGEEIIPLEPLSLAIDLAISACTRLQTVRDAGIIVELGVDILFDQQWQPWVIEVNGRPAGRLGALARINQERFGPIRDSICLRPILYLAAKHCTE